MAVTMEIKHARVVPMRELTESTSKVINEIYESGEQAIVTKHGTVLALITPLKGKRIASMVLSSDEQLNALIKEAEAEEQAEGYNTGLSLEEARARIRDE